MKGELNVRREGKKRDCHFCGNCNSTPPDAVSHKALLGKLSRGGPEQKRQIHSALKSKSRSGSPKRKIHFV
jgi:hypothetical protein